MFERLKQSLIKTKENIANKMNQIFATFRKVDESFLDELEEVLISSDVSVSTSEKIKNDLRNESPNGMKINIITPRILGKRKKKCAFSFIYIFIFSIVYYSFIFKLSCLSTSSDASETDISPFMHFNALVSIISFTA